MKVNSFFDVRADIVSSDRTAEATDNMHKYCGFLVFCVTRRKNRKKRFLPYVSRQNATFLPYCDSLIYHNI